MQRFSLAPAPNSAQEPKTETQTGFRVFRPPLSAWVQLERKCPTRVAFQGRIGKVICASGPWRTSGDWWEDQPWQEDNWDIEIDFSGDSLPAQGFYRISYDLRLEKWWVRGVYD